MPNKHIITHTHTHLHTHMHTHTNYYLCKHSHTTKRTLTHTNIYARIHIIIYVNTRIQISHTCTSMHAQRRHKQYA